MTETDGLDPELTSMIRALALAVYTCRLYPNPTVQDSFARAMSSLSELEGVLPLTVSVRRAGFERVQAGEREVSVASELYDRGVEELTLRSVPTPTEMMAFCDLVTEPADSVERAGGAASFLTARGCLSMRIRQRELKIEDPDTQVADPPSALPTDLPERISLLLTDPDKLAEQIGADGPPAEALQRLREVAKEARDAGLSEHEAYSRVADTAASLPPDHRNLAIRDALGSGDDFSVALINQMSDGEIAEALVQIATDVGTQLVIAYAHKAVTFGSGQRTQLPAIVADRLLKAGIDRREILKAIGTERLLGSVQRLSMAEPSEADSDATAVRTEAEAATLDTFADGFELIETLLKHGPDEEREHLLGLASSSFRSWIQTDHADRALDLMGALVAAASAPDPVRSQAIEAAIGATITSEALSALDDSQTDRLVRALGTKTMPALVQRLAVEEQASRRKALVDFLARASAEDPAGLSEHLGDPRWFLVRNVVSVLGKIGGPVAIPGLVRALRHDDARVRKEAVRALAGVGAAGMTPVIRSLADPDGSVRMAAISGLSMIDHDDATAALVTVVRRSPMLEEREEAVISLRLQGRERSIAALEKLASRKLHLTSKSRHVTETAIAQLKLLRQARASEAGQP